MYFVFIEVWFIHKSMQRHQVFGVMSPCNHDQNMENISIAWNVPSRPFPVSAPSLRGHRFLTHVIMVYFYLFLKATGVEWESTLFECIFLLFLNIYIYMCYFEIHEYWAIPRLGVSVFGSFWCWVVVKCSDFPTICLSIWFAQSGCTVFYPD